MLRLWPVSRDKDPYTCHASGHKTKMSCEIMKRNDSNPTKAGSFTRVRQVLSMKTMQLFISLGMTNVCVFETQIYSQPAC